jgi:hypothetical protein
MFPFSVLRTIAKSLTLLSSTGDFVKIVGTDILLIGFCLGLL